jgi:hypothetical protein
MHPFLQNISLMNSKKITMSLSHEYRQSSRVTLIHHQGTICGVAVPPEAGKRSLLVAAYMTKGLKAQGRCSFQSSVRPVPCADTAACI